MSETERQTSVAPIHPPVGPGDPVEEIQAWIFELEAMRESDDRNMCLMEARCWLPRPPAPPVTDHRRVICDYCGKMLYDGQIIHGLCVDPHRHVVLCRCLRWVAVPVGSA